MHYVGISFGNSSVTRLALCWQSVAAPLLAQCVSDVFGSVLAILWQYFQLFVGGCLVHGVGIMFWHQVGIGLASRFGIFALCLVLG